MTQEPTNPNLLSEAKIDSLDKLFSEDPLKLQDSELDVVVAAMRAQRATWAQAEAEGKKSAPKAKAPKAKLSLDDLDGES